MSFDAGKKNASLFQQNFEKDSNIKRIKLNPCCFNFNLVFIFYDSDKKPLLDRIAAFFWLQYFHNEHYKDDSFLLI